MFDNIPSLKDFILYFLPGAIITASIYHLYKDDSLKLSDGLVISIGIVVSLALGFVTSQTQIIIFKRVFQNTCVKSLMKSKKPDIGDKLESSVLAKLKTQFKNQTLDATIELMDSSEILELCYAYCATHGSAEMKYTLDRSKNLSNFSLCLPIPIAFMLAIPVLTCDIASCKVAIPIALTIFLLVLMSLTKIYLNFQKAYRNDILIHFLVITLTKKGTVEA